MLHIIIASVQYSNGSKRIIGVYMSCNICFSLPLECLKEVGNLLISNITLVIINTRTICDILNLENKKYFPSNI